MARTRAERRLKKASIKQAAWNRSYKKELFDTQQKVWFKDTRTYGVYTEEHLPDLWRKEVRNEGKWRYAGVKPTYGCGANCWYCNPHLSMERLKERIARQELEWDYQDFLEWLYDD